MYFNTYQIVCKPSASVRKFANAPAVPRIATCQQPPGSPWGALLGRARWAWIAALICLLHTSLAAGAGFETRLRGVEAAVEAHLQASPGAGTPYPKPWRKILWIRLQGDALPDALVVLRPGRNECGAAAMTPQPCQALLLAGQPDGGYRLATEFPLLFHPLALLLNGQGQVTELLYSADLQATPRYARYRWSGSGFQRQDGTLDASQVRKLPTLMADDRNMALLEDQRYAARNFSNDDARMAPYRLHFDAMAIARYELMSRDDVSKAAPALVKSALPMVQGMAKGFPWAQTLEVRLWSCVDWMVPRRFWEVEGQRLGRLGACIEPALMIQLMGGEQAAAVSVVKQLLTQQFGMALLLRTAPLSANDREAFRRAGSLSVFSAALAGMWIGQATCRRTSRARTTLQFDRNPHDRADGRRRLGAERLPGHATGWGRRQQFRRGPICHQLHRGWDPWRDGGQRHGEVRWQGNRRVEQAKK
jgi:hypothetical protein